ncbi:MAG: hypothetical protein JWN34_4020, partial [Bryobacterales bacterium]|nr:hypothetical protein [Bryobacterales bacterium]
LRCELTGACGPTRSDGRSGGGLLLLSWRTGSGGSGRGAGPWRRRDGRTGTNLTHGARSGRARHRRRGQRRQRLTGSGENLAGARRRGRDGTSRRGHGATGGGAHGGREGRPRFGPGFGCLCFRAKSLRRGGLHRGGLCGRRLGGCCLGRTRFASVFGGRPNGRRERQSGGPGSEWRVDGAAATEKWRAERESAGAHRVAVLVVFLWLAGCRIACRGRLSGRHGERPGLSRGGIGCGDDRRGGVSAGPGNWGARGWRSDGRSLRSVGLFGPDCRGLFGPCCRGLFGPCCRGLVGPCLRCLVGLIGGGTGFLVPRSGTCIIVPNFGRGVIVDGA